MELIALQVETLITQLFTDQKIAIKNRLITEIDHSVENAFSDISAKLTKIISATLSTTLLSSSITSSSNNNTNNCQPQQINESLIDRILMKINEEQQQRCNSNNNYDNENIKNNNNLEPLIIIKEDDDDDDDNKYNIGQELQHSLLNNNINNKSKTVPITQIYSSNSQFSQSIIAGTLLSNYHNEGDGGDDENNDNADQNVDDDGGVSDSFNLEQFSQIIDNDVDIITKNLHQNHQQSQQHQHTSNMDLNFVANNNNQSGNYYQQQKRQRLQQLLPSTSSSINNNKNSQQVKDDLNLNHNDDQSNNDDYDEDNGDDGDEDIIDDCDDFRDLDFVVSSGNRFNRNTIKKSIQTRSSSIQFRCYFPGCGHVAKTRSNLQHHYKWHQSMRDVINRHHNNQQPNQHQKYPSSSSYLATSSTSSYFQCPFVQCGKVFNNKRNLWTHQRTHLRIKPFRCRWPGCMYESEDRANAVRHIRVRHFNLPSTLKEQSEKGIIDDRDPKQYLEIVDELLKPTE